MRFNDFQMHLYILNWLKNFQYTILNISLKKSILVCSYRQKQGKIYKTEDVVTKLLSKFSILEKKGTRTTRV